MLDFLIALVCTLAAAGFAVLSFVVNEMRRSDDHHKLD
jgi:hypothetical protein